MNVSSGGDSVRRAVIDLSVKADPSNAARVKALGQQIRGAQQKASEDTAKAAEKELMSLGRYHTQRMQWSRQYYNEQGRLQLAQMRREEQHYARLGREHMARMRREKEYAQEQEQIRQAAAKELRERERDRSIGGRQAMHGVFQMARGMAEFGIAHLSGSDRETRNLERLVERMVEVQGLYNMASGGAQVLGGLGRMGAFRGVSRMGNRMASRFLLGMEGAVGGINAFGRLGMTGMPGSTPNLLSGVGAFGGSSMAAAGSVALPAAAAIGSTALVARQVYEMLALKPKDRVVGNTIGRFENEAMKSVAGVMPNWVNNLAPSWTSYGASVQNERSDRALERAQRSHAMKVSQQRLMYELEQAEFERANREARIPEARQAMARAMQLQQALIPQGAMLEGRKGLELQLEGTRIRQTSINNQIVDVQAAQSSLDPKNDQKRVELAQKLFDLQQQQLPLIEQERQLKREILAGEIEILRQRSAQMTARAGGFSEGLRGAQIAAGRATPMEIARLESLIAQKKAGRELTTEESDFIAQFMGQAGRESQDADYQKKGASILDRLGLSQPETDALGSAAQASGEIRKQEIDLRMNVAVQVERDSQQISEAVAKKVTEALIKLLEAQNSQANKQAQIAAIAAASMGASGRGP